MPTYKININNLLCTNPGDPAAGFVPATIAVSPGDCVFWTNNTPNIHQPAMKLPDGSVWDLVDKIPGTIEGGSPASSGNMCPDADMTINYFCALHTNEKGIINVVTPPTQLTASPKEEA